ncbi:hypothetical protein [Actinomadura rupiterrae]|uniref:hypothetical protein n=1 Tax=Actinomadura rupiterrae TaxID=559627 RepID=UPI0020A3F0DD|nr:hypothetical protein [Actinomadura rupiterrae]MCP2342391.1 hypothetical protein [Actinomadura rupiterrae]
MERPNDRFPSVLRFATELVAWVGVPWALWSHSWVLAVLALVVLIGLPTVFSTPGDKANVIVPVPGAVTIALVVLHLVAAVVVAWTTWPAYVAVVVSVLAAATVFTERRRWRWLLSLGRSPAGRRPA